MAHIGFYKQADQDLRAVMSGDSQQQMKLWAGRDLFIASGVADAAEPTRQHRSPRICDAFILDWILDAFFRMEKKKGNFPLTHARRRCSSVKKRLAARQHCSLRVIN